MISQNPLHSNIHWLLRSRRSLSCTAYMYPSTYSLGYITSFKNNNTVTKISIAVFSIEFESEWSFIEIPSLKKWNVAKIWNIFVTLPHERHSVKNKIGFHKLLLFHKDIFYYSALSGTAQSQSQNRETSFKLAGSRDFLAFLSMKLTHLGPDKQAKMVFVFAAIFERLHHQGI